MNITISRPSAMDAKVVADKGTAPEDLLTVKPRRFSKAQRKVLLFPFQVALDAEERGAFDKAPDGVTDRGYIALDVRTGQLTIEHRLSEVSVVPEKK